MLLFSYFITNYYNDLMLPHFAWHKERDSYSLTLINNHWARQEIKMFAYSSPCHMPKITSIHYTNCNNLFNHPDISYP